MPTESITNAVDYLLKRRFGTLAPSPGTVLPLNANPSSNALHAFADDRQRNIAAARAEYMAMDADQIQECVNVARLEDAQAFQTKARREEQALFFNQPEANADLAYWSKLSLWTLDEAVALSLGKNPERVNWYTLNGGFERFILHALTISQFPKEFAQRRKLVFRALEAGDLTDPIKPMDFLLWGQDTFDSIPAELMRHVEARGKPKDRSPSVTDEPQQDAADKLKEQRAYRSLGGQTKRDNSVKTHAKVEAKLFWNDWKAAKHPKIRTTEQFAQEVMKKWPCLTSAQVICKWSAQWTKESKT